MPDTADNFLLGMPAIGLIAALETLCQFETDNGRAANADTLQNLITTSRKSIDGLFGNSAEQQIYLNLPDVFTLRRYGVVIHRDRIEIGPCVVSPQDLGQLEQTIKNILSLETQAPLQVAVEFSQILQAENRDTDERALPKLFRDVKRIMCWSESGRRAVAHIEQNGVPVFFVTPKPGNTETRDGYYAPYDGGLRIYRSTPSKLRMAQVAVHEADHSWQHINFPEMYRVRSPVDVFVTGKLKELHADMMDECHRMFVNLVRLPLKLVDRSDNTHGRHLLERLNSQTDRTLLQILLRAAKEHGGKVDDPSGAMDLSNIFLRQDEKINWAYYEIRFFTPGLIEDLQSGEFAQRVASSKFLQPDFLRRYCLNLDGKTFIPENPEEYIGKLASKISELHHPMLIRIANGNLTKDGVISPEEPPGRPPQLPVARLVGNADIKQTMLF